MYNFIDFTGKRIIVAGASSGIGRQTAITLSRLGAEVILLARREEKLVEVLRELEGTANSYYCVDLSMTDMIGGLFKTILSEHGKLDGLVYSAGICFNMPLHLMKREKSEQIFATNFYGYAECVKQICKKGRFNEGLRIVGVSSCASLYANKTLEAYSASKSAMDSFTRCVALEQAEKGVSINTVAPAWVKTDMFDSYEADGGTASEAFASNMKRQYKGMINTDDVANAIVFLLSPAANMITGHTLPVDGGASTC